MTRGVRPALPAGPYLVVGLARSGAAAARMLAAHGEVIGCDSGEPEEARELDGVEVVLGSDGSELVERVATLVKSPGVPSDAPAVAEARRRGVPIVGELELAWRLLPESEFIAVTGTNGKTTTTELLGEMHRRAGVGVAVAGNVGIPVADLVERGAAPAVVVAECSSFQLEDAPAFAPECALLLNLEPDHLDRHRSFEAYRDAKLSMFGRLSNADIAVAPPALMTMIETAARRVSFGEPGADVEVAGGAIAHRGGRIAGAAEVRMLGAHNLQNAMAATAVARERGLPAAAVAQALREFPGVAHRLERVAEIGEVAYVNDSKATNVASAVAGITAFENGVHVILGGTSKGGGFDGLREAVAERCRAAYLIGTAADAIARDLDGATRLERCGDLGIAVRAAAAAAGPGEVVLLSPACASFDQFRDYEDRGAAFRAIVAELAG